MRFEWGEMMCYSSQNRSQANCSQESDAHLLTLSAPIIPRPLVVSLSLSLLPSSSFFPPLPTHLESPTFFFFLLFWAAHFAQHEFSYKLICTANQIGASVCQISGFIPATVWLWCTAVEFLIVTGRHSACSPAAALMLLWCSEVSSSSCHCLVFTPLAIPTFPRRILSQSYFEFFCF